MAAGLSIKAGLLLRMLPNMSASAEAAEAEEVAIEVGSGGFRRGLLTKAAAAAACFNILTVSVASVLALLLLNL